MLDVNIEFVKDITIVSLKGDLDALAPDDIQQQIIDQSTPPGRKIILDMENVNYMSSAGLRTLLLLYRHISENKGQIVVAGLNEEVRDVMAITGFIDFFRTVPSRSAAMEAFQ